MNSNSKQETTYTEKELQPYKEWQQYKEYKHHALICAIRYSRNEPVITIIEIAAIIAQEFDLAEVEALIKELKVRKEIK